MRGVLLRGLLAFALLGSTATTGASEAQVSEYRVKTAFLYNFSRFVSWPAAAMESRSEFSLCVIGSDPFGEQLDKLTGKTVQARTLVVRRLGADGATGSCHLLYIGDDADHGRVLASLRTQPVLTVADAPGFVEQGGIIQFHLVQNKVRFRINAGAADTAGLTVSSKLLSLATEVTGRQ